MYLSYVVIGLFILLMLWGGKFSGIKEFHEDHFSLDNTRSLRGMAAVGVIVHHIARLYFFHDYKVLHSFYDAGYLFVSIFLFSSGFGLARSLKNKPGYLKGFLRKRLPVIIVPFYVSAVICTFVMMVDGYNFPLGRIVCNLIGLTAANDFAWYPIVLTILYIVFYLTFRKRIDLRKGFIVFFAVVIGLGLIFAFNGHFPWWYWRFKLYDDPNYFPWWAETKLLWFSGEWWANSNIAFLTGLLFAFNEEKINAFFRKLYFVKLLVLLELYIGSSLLSIYGREVFGYWTEFRGDGPGIGDKIITFFMQMPQVALFVILIYVIFMKYRFNNPVLKFFGNYSYETYMMNYLPTILIEPLAEEYTVEKFRVIYFIAVFAATIVSALIYKEINKPLIRFFKEAGSKKG